MTTITDRQFTALATVLRLRSGSAREAVRLALVEGLSVSEAALSVGMRYELAYKAVKRARNGLALALIAVGEDASGQTNR